jgi:hypothetical protein
MSNPWIDGGKDTDPVSSVPGAEAPEKTNKLHLIIIGACLLGLAVVLAYINQ